ncbi:MAG: hypothetical protein K2J90_03360 [Lachnospiraceae bacterium]|nr:hypothetical protein [Lachnospiraceae bacterium]
MNKMKVIWNLSRIEMQRLVRSTKIIILAILLIFINIQIIMPLRELSVFMEHRVSVFEPFIATGNSGIIVLILPLFFITMMADFPREGRSQYFCQIRCSKGIWIAGQLVYAVEGSVSLVLFIFVSSVLLSLDFTSWSMDYSYAVTRYAAVFPERAGEYVVELIPENLYNQVSLAVALVHTVLLLISYFIMLALFILLFSLVQKKMIGIFLDGILILLGVIACVGRTSYMWVFPMAHTITWLHYSEYQSKEVLPLFYSYLYFAIINIVLMVLSIVMGKKYHSV